MHSQSRSLDYLGGPDSGNEGWNCHARCL